MEKTRLKLGQVWYEMIKAGKTLHKRDINHPYIKEYLNSIKTEEPKKRGK